MPTSPAITIVQPHPDGSLPIPAAAPAAESSAQALQERAEALQDQVDDFQALLAKPLNEILWPTAKRRWRRPPHGTPLAPCGCCRSAPCAAWRWTWQRSKA
jgi:hypothetical protein